MVSEMDPIGAVVLRSSKKARAKVASILADTEKAFAEGGDDASVAAIRTWLESSLNFRF